MKAYKAYKIEIPETDVDNSDKPYSSTITRAEIHWLVQKKAFRLGYKWYYSDKQEIDNLNATFLYFYSTGDMTHDCDRGNFEFHDAIKNKISWQDFLELDEPGKQEKSCETCSEFYRVSGIECISPCVDHFNWQPKGQAKENKDGIIMENYLDLQEAVTDELLNSKEQPAEKVYCGGCKWMPTQGNGTKCNNMKNGIDTWEEIVKGDCKDINKNNDCKYFEKYTGE